MTNFYTQKVYPSDLHPPPEFDNTPNTQFTPHDKIWTGIPLRHFRFRSKQLIGGNSGDAIGREWFRGYAGWGGVGEW